MYLLNVEYRFPVLDIYHGVKTLPVWAQRLTGSLFFDAGQRVLGAHR
jgi:hypothetical protein